MGSLKSPRQLGSIFIDRPSGIIIDRPSGVVMVRAVRVATSDACQPSSPIKTIDKNSDTKKVRTQAVKSEHGRRRHCWVGRQRLDGPSYRLDGRRRLDAV